MHFEALKILDTHLSFLKEKVSDTPLFLVGGVVRDILLGRNFSPTDIDVSCPGHPEDVAKKIDKKKLSFFQTEKYGTMTLLPKQQNMKTGKHENIITGEMENGKCNIKRVSPLTPLPRGICRDRGTKGGDSCGLQYEITPFRSEGGYGDHRHPDEIVWSDNLVLDAGRRDFTINALYYTSVVFEHLKEKEEGVWTKNGSREGDGSYTPLCLEKKELKDLAKNGVLWIGGAGVLLLQSHSLIEQCMKVGKGQRSIPKGSGLLKKAEGKGKSFGLDKDFVFSLVKSLSPDDQPASVGLLLDPYKGLQDMMDGKIACVGDPDMRVQEDALRILRALRFAVQLNSQQSNVECLTSNAGSKKDCHAFGSQGQGEHAFASQGQEEHACGSQGQEGEGLSLEASGLKLVASFDIEGKTWMALKKNYYSLQWIAKERVRQELMKAAETNNLFGFVSLLDEINVLKYFFPALQANKGNNQPIRYHPFDVYHHSLLALFELEKLQNVSRGCNQIIGPDDCKGGWEILKLACLYHDVGKSEQYYSHSLRLTKDEAQTMYSGWVNHIRSGVDMAKHDFAELKFSNKEVDDIAWYISLHMRPGQIVMAEEKQWKKKVRLLYSEAGYERVRNLLWLCISDVKATYNPLQTSFEAEFWHLLTLLDELQREEGQFTLKELAINGNDLMKHFGKTGGAWIKEMLAKALEWVMEDIAGRNDTKKILAFLDKKNLSL